MPEMSRVFEDRESPGQWRIERLDDDGGCEVEIFNSPRVLLLVIPGRSG